MQRVCLSKYLLATVITTGLIFPGTAALAYQTMTQAEYNAMVKKDPNYRNEVLAGQVAYNGRGSGKAKRAYSYSRNYSAFPKERDATGNKVFIFSPASLAWAVYDADGQRVRVGPASGGRSYCPDIGRGCRTPSGVYHVYSKAGPSYRSKKFPVPRGGAPMPYAMFFRGGYAIHGSYDVPGYNASHGCIRVLPSDAEWLNNDFLNNGSTVIVQSYRS